MKGCYQIQEVLFAQTLHFESVFLFGQLVSFDLLEDKFENSLIHLRNL